MLRSPFDHTEIIAWLIFLTHTIELLSFSSQRRALQFFFSLSWHCALLKENVVDQSLHICFSSVFKFLKYLVEQGIPSRQVYTKCNAPNH